MVCYLKYTSHKNSWSKNNWFKNYRPENNWLKKCPLEENHWFNPLTPVFTSLSHRNNIRNTETQVPSGMKGLRTYLQSCLAAMATQLADTRQSSTASRHMDADTNTAGDRWSSGARGGGRPICWRGERGRVVSHRNMSFEERFLTQNYASILCKNGYLLFLIILK